MSPEHRLIGLYAINEMVLEMTYVNKGKNVTINRRVSLNFRDSSLFQIFKQTLTFNKQMIEEIAVQANQVRELTFVQTESL